MTRDIYTGPEGDPDPPANSRPPAALAGCWAGDGSDRHPEDPAVDPDGRESLEERYGLQPIDFQTMARNCSTACDITRTRRR